MSVRKESALGRELRYLNSGQLRVVLSRANLVVRAGPGSGKTRTLVAKVAYLLAARVAPWQGVAAITYTRDAANEIRRRLGSMGLEGHGRVSCGTVHGWCLSSILGPYGHLVGVRQVSRVISDEDPEWLAILQECFDELGITVNPSYEKSSITKLRRLVASGRLGDASGGAMIDAARLFDTKLAARGIYDHDAIVSGALEVVRGASKVREILALKYPWIVIDEYQDLGPVLHELVLTLNSDAGINVAAFGDPDQTVMGFAGADPAYLSELSGLFNTRNLGINYRSGGAIIAAASHILESGSDFQSKPAAGARDGVVEFLEIKGGLEEHANAVAMQIGESEALGLPLHEIAVLYPRKGPILDALMSGLDRHRIKYFHERDQRFPRGRLVEFARNCATRAIAGHQPLGQFSSVRVPDVDELVRSYLEIRSWLGMSRVSVNEARILLWSVVTPEVGKSSARLSLDDWLSGFIDVLQLRTLLDAPPAGVDLDGVRSVLDLSRQNALELGDFALGAVRPHQVVLTNYHAAKGREWDVIILPGLIDGLFPRRRWSAPQRRFLNPDPEKLQEERRAFYVGLTRARESVSMIYGSTWLTPWGKTNRTRASRFVLELKARLEM